MGAGHGETTNGDVADLLGRLAARDWQIVTRGGLDGATWAGGACGAVHLWTQAHAIFGEDRWAALGVQAGERVHRTGGRSTGLWCGAAGRAYALLCCYRMTGGLLWYRRAERLAMGALRVADPDHRTVLRLFQGVLGVYLLGVELDAAPARARMPMFEEGWHRARASSDMLGG